MRSVSATQLPSRRPPSGLAVLSALVLAAALASCATTRAVSPPPESVASSHSWQVERRSEISAYTTRDGARHAWLGTVEPIAGDSLLFVIPAERERGLASARPEKRLALARQDVATITGRSPMGAVVAWTIFGSAALLVSAIAVLSHWSD